MNWRAFLYELFDREDNCISAPSWCDLNEVWCLKRLFRTSERDLDTPVLAFISTNKTIKISISRHGRLQLSVFLWSNFQIHFTLQKPAECCDLGPVLVQVLLMLVIWSTVDTSSLCGSQETSLLWAEVVRLLQGIFPDQRVFIKLWFIIHNTLYFKLEPHPSASRGK